MSRPSILSDAPIEESGVRTSEDCHTDVTFESQVARLLIKSLDEHCSRYCILSGYEELPHRVNTDIDFMVSAHDFKRVPALLGEIAAAAGASLFQVVPHEISGRAFFLVKEGGASISFVQPDSCSDYRHFGKLWLHSDEVLGSRRWHERGFWVPGAACEFIYYLIKRINKHDVTLSHTAKLSRLYIESPSECNLWLNRFWAKRSAKALTKMAESGDWRPLANHLEGYRSEMRSHSRKKFSIGTSAIHLADRLLKPTGGWIAFIGPDGCGKSAVIEIVAADFAPAFQKVVRRHLRPKALPATRADEVPVTDPHGQAVRGSVYSAAKMIYLFLDYWIGYFLRVKSETVRTRLVIFDRYFYDILIDPERVLYGGPRWLPRLLSHLIPRPEIVFLLNASPDVLWSRKQEVPYEEVVRQQREFLDLARRMPSAVVVDAARPLQEVRHQVQRTIIEHFSLRTQRRLDIPAKAVEDLHK